MKLIDSHTHLYFAEDFPDQEAVVKRALDAGVEHMVLPGVNSSTIAPIKKLHAMFPEHTSMTIGLHPSDVAKDTFGEELAIIESELNVSSQEYVAIGEIGIDLHWETHNIDLQQQAFECQLNFAKEFKLPVVIHSRDAFEQTHEVLKGIYA